MAQKIFVGVDLHKTQFTVCVLVDEKLIDNGTKYPMSNEGFTAFISELQMLSASHDNSSVVLAIESTANARFFRDTMESQGYEVVVVNTLRFKVVNMSTKKTDKNDARTLVEFLSKDILPESHLCSPYSECIRRILKCRSLMVQDSVALKNQVHAILLAYGYTTKPAQFQSAKSRANMMSMLSDSLREVVKELFETLDGVEVQIRRLEQKLRKFTADDEYVRLLMTIPGIGIVNACTIASFTDDINRFESYKNFSAFCGLVPWVQSSNESVYYGKITKRGPEELRTALVQCVVAMVRMPEKTATFSIMKQYQQLKEEKSSGKAIIATARKLSRIIYIMLRDRVPFNQSRLIEPTYLTD